MILDQLIAIRILYLLVTPFVKSEAYKLGVIDDKGNAKLKIVDMNSAQKNSYTMLHRLCFRLKKVLGVLPFGKTTLASIGAAYVLVRENLDSEDEPENLEHLFEEKLKSLPLLESKILEGELETLFELLEKVSGEFISLSEEGVATNTTGGISAAATNTPVISPKKSKILYLSRDKFKKVKVSEDRQLSVKEFSSLEEIDFVIEEETNECLVL